jgi:hypothetical protein
MKVIGNMLRPELPAATKPAEATAEGLANPPQTPNPTLDGTAEGGPPRGGMQEIFRTRQGAQADVPPDQLRFGARKGLNEVNQAVRESVHDALESGELSEDQADALKDAANAMRAELLTAKRGIVPGEIETGQAAFDAVGEAVQDFFGTLEGILGESGDSAIDTGDTAAAEVVSLAAEEEVVAVESSPDAEVAVVSDPDTATSTAFAGIVASVTDALDAFGSALEDGPSRRANPFASFYEAVGMVSSPISDATSTTETLV